MRRHFFIIILTSLLAFSCGTKRSVSEVGGVKNATTKKVLKRYAKTEPRFKTLLASLRGTYNDGHDKQSISVSMRMRKDEKIWLSASIAGFIPLAKMLITPDRVQFYDKINQRYFDGDYRLLSNKLGAKMDFQKVQGLLLGQAGYELDDDEYNLKTSESGYVLSSIDQSRIIQSFLFDNRNFRLKKHQIKYAEASQNATISYPTYEEKDGALYPKKIKVVANHGDKATKIDIKYRNLEINKPVKFPFKIPSGYQEIVL